MPVLAGDAFGIGISMDRQDLGVSVRAGRVRVDVQVTKMPAEGFLLIKIDLLVAEEQHLMFGQRRVQIVDLLIAQCSGKVDTRNHGADARGHRRHLDGGVAHAKVLQWVWPVQPGSATVTRSPGVSQWFIRHTEVV